MKLLVIQWSPALCCFHPLVSKFSTQHQVSHSTQLDTHTK